MIKKLITKLRNKDVLGLESEKLNESELELMMFPNVKKSFKFNCNRNVDGKSAISNIPNGNYMWL